VGLGLFQKFAERAESVIGFAETGFAAFEGLFDHGPPNLLAFSAFRHEGLVGFDDEVPGFLFLIGLSGRQGKLSLVRLARKDKIETGRGCDPKNEILRVYTYLGDNRTRVKEWLAACLWKSLSGAGNPRGLVVQRELNDRALGLGVSTREWIDAPLRIPGTSG